MFPINLRSLSGDLKQEDITADTEVTELRDRMSKELPRFHHLKLVFGNEEIYSGSAAEVGLSAGAEVQMISFFSIDEALGEVLALNRELHQFMRDYDYWCFVDIKDYSSFPACTESIFDAAEQAVKLCANASTALELLSRSAGWTNEQCAQLLKIMNSRMTKVHTTNSQYRKTLVEALVCACADDVATSIPALIWESIPDFVNIACTVLERLDPSQPPLEERIEWCQRQQYCALMGSYGKPGMDLSYLQEVAVNRHISWYASQAAQKALREIEDRALRSATPCKTVDDFDIDASCVAAAQETQARHNGTSSKVDGLFGGAAAGSGGLLGAKPTGGGLFGGAPATGGGLFGSNSGGGLFTGGGLFGANTGGGLFVFGGAAATGGSLFGANTGGGLCSVPAVTGGLFGGAAPASGGWFGDAAGGMGMLAAQQPGLAMQSALGGSDAYGLSGHPDAVTQELTHLFSEVSIQEVGDLDTDLDLDVALAESEREAVMQEQIALHDALLYDKALNLQLLHCKTLEVEESADAVLLLRFGRNPKELRSALLASSLASRLAIQGVELEPPWAPGRMILADGVNEAALSEARVPWHVAVRVRDEAEIYETIKSELPHDERPRLKNTDGRFLLPAEASLFAVSSRDHSDWADWRDLDAYWTFLHEPATQVLPKSSTSTPPGL